MQVKAISACPDTDSATVAADPAGAFSALYAEHFGGLVSLLYRRVGDRALAEDLTQDMFVRLWSDVARGAVDLSEVRSPFGWLATRALWVVAGHYRRAGTRAEAALDNDVVLVLADRMLADQAEDPTALVTARIGVGQLILNLPFQPRRALALHLLEDMPVPAVADETGLSEHEVKAHVADGLSRLRVLLGVRAEHDEAWSTRARSLAARVPQVVTDGTPLAVHVRAGIRAAVTAGMYPVGAVLPSFRTLVQLFAPSGKNPADVNPSSVSKALAGLCREGVLTRAGGGYSVASVPTGQAPVIGNRPKDVARQLADIIAAEYAPGAALPFAPALARRLGCTRSAVNRALSRLCEFGLVARPVRATRRAGYTVAGVRYTLTDPTPATPAAPARIPARRRAPEDLTPVASI